MAGPWDAYAPPSPASGAKPWEKYTPPAPIRTESDFRTTMDKDFGAGRWKETSGYRPPWKNYQVGGVADSHHMLGSPEAPGAHDIVVPGMSSTQIASRLRADHADFSKYYPEGDHLHVDSDMAAPAPSEAKPWQRYAAPAPPPNHPAAKYAARRNPTQAGPAPTGFAALKANVSTDIMGATSKGRAALAKDFGSQGPAKQDPYGVRTAGDLIETGLEGVEGAARTLSRAILPGQGGNVEGFDPQKAREKLGGVASAVVPIPGLGEAKAAEVGVEEAAAAARAAGRAATRGEEHLIGTEVKPVERIDNAFYRAGGRATAAKIEAKQAVRKALKTTPKGTLGPKHQEELTHAVEARMADPEAKIPEHLQAAEAARAPWAERQTTAVNAIREKMAAKGATPEEIEAYAGSDQTGFVPRYIKGKSPELNPADPQGEGRNPLQFQFGKKSLSTRTASTQARTMFVREHPSGRREFVGSMPQAEAKASGLKPATIKEIEANTDIRYHKNAMVNTVTRALRDERVLDNLNLIEETTKHAIDERLAHRVEWHNKNEAGEWVRRTNPLPDHLREAGWKPVDGVPALKGIAFSPEIHQVLTDVLKPHEGEEDPAFILGKVTRALNASLFATPFIHIKNIGVMSFIARGWDNVLPHTYPRLLRTASKAMKEVATMGPVYRQFLREGGALQAGDDWTRNFHESMLKMVGEQMTNDKKTAADVAKAFGMAPVEVVKAIYAASHKALWNVNDMMMLQRYLELQQKGMPARAAIKEAERWIANYRVPPQVMKSRGFQRLLTKSGIVNFPSYSYARWKALAEMVKGVSHGTPKERLDVLGKVAMLGVMGMFVQPLMNVAAKKLTGNPNAYVPAGGEMGIVQAGTDIAADAAGMDIGGKLRGAGASDPYMDALTIRQKDWGADMASFLTPTPALEIGQDFFTGRYGWSGQQIVDPNASPLGKNVERGEAAASFFYPADLAMGAAKPGGGVEALARLAGAASPQTSGEPKGKVSKMLRSQAKRREKRDPVKQMFSQ